LALLVSFAISAISFTFLVSIYISDTQTFILLGFFSLIPYYLCWGILAGFFIYVSPGLTDPTNKIPIYQVIMAAIYLILGFVYPLMMAIVFSVNLPKN
jgi:hypothetical protein